MKRKILIVFMTVICAIYFCIGFTACATGTQVGTDDSYISDNASGTTDDNTDKTEDNNTETNDNNNAESSGDDGNSSENTDNNDNTGNENADESPDNEEENSDGETPEQSGNEDTDADNTDEQNTDKQPEEETDYSAYVAYKDENGVMQINLDVMTATLISFMQNENYYGVTYEKLYTQGAITAIDYSAYDSTNDMVLIAGRSANTSGTKYMFYVGAACSIGTSNVTTDELYDTFTALYMPKNFTYKSYEYLNSDQETLSTDDAAFVDAVKVIIQQNNPDDTIICTYVTDYENTAYTANLGNTQTWVAYTISLNENKIAIDTHTICASTQLGEGNAVNNVLKNNSAGLYYNTSATDLLESVSISSLTASD